MIDFFKKKKESKPLSWSDITLDKYIRISKVADDNDRLFNTINIIFDCDVFAIPLKDFAGIVNGYISRVDFLKSEINRNKKFGKVIKVNGSEYVMNLGGMTTAQFIDFGNILKSGKFPDKMVDLLAVVLVPKGQKYGEYDLDEVKSDVLSLDIETVMSICFFFNASLMVFMENFRYYLNRETDKMDKMTERQREMLKEIIGKQLDNLELLVM